MAATALKVRHKRRLPLPCGPAAACGACRMPAAVIACLAALAACSSERPPLPTRDATPDQGGRGSDLGPDDGGAELSDHAAAAVDAAADLGTADAGPCQAPPPPPACQPAAEVCNAVDDDCDGELDEGHQWVQDGWDVPWPPGETIWDPFKFLDAPYGYQVFWWTRTDADIVPCGNRFQLTCPAEDGIVQLYRMRIGLDGSIGSPECLWFDGELCNRVVKVALGPTEQEYAVLEDSGASLDGSDAVIVIKGEEMRRYPLGQSTYGGGSIKGCRSNNSYHFIYCNCDAFCHESSRQVTVVTAPIDIGQEDPELTVISIDIPNTGEVDEWCDPDLLAMLLEGGMTPHRFLLVTYVPGADRIEQQVLDLPAGSRPIRLVRFQRSLWLLLEHDGRLLLQDLLPRAGLCGRQLDLGPEVAAAAASGFPVVAALDQALDVAFPQVPERIIRHFLVQPGVSARELPPMSVRPDTYHDRATLRTVIGTTSGSAIQWISSDWRQGLGTSFVMRRFSCPGVQ